MAVARCIERWKPVHAHYKLRVRKGAKLETLERPAAVATTASRRPSCARRSTTRIPRARSPHRDRAGALPQLRAAQRARPRLLRALRRVPQLGADDAHRRRPGAARRRPRASTSRVRPSEGAATQAAAPLPDAPSTVSQPPAEDPAQPGEAREPESVEDAPSTVSQAPSAPTDDALAPPAGDGPNAPPPPAPSPAGLDAAPPVAPSGTPVPPPMRPPGARGAGSRPPAAPATASPRRQPAAQAPALPPPPPASHAAIAGMADAAPASGDASIVLSPEAATLGAAGVPAVDAGGDAHVHRDDPQREPARRQLRHRGARPAGGLDGRHAADGLPRAARRRPRRERPDGPPVDHPAARVPLDGRHLDVRGRRDVADDRDRRRARDHPVRGQAVSRVVGRGRAGRHVGAPEGPLPPGGPQRRQRRAGPVAHRAGGERAAADPVRPRQADAAARRGRRRRADAAPAHPAADRPHGRASRRRRRRLDGAAGARGGAGREGQAQGQGQGRGEEARRRREGDLEGRAAAQAAPAEVPEPAEEAEDGREHAREDARLGGPDRAAHRTPGRLSPEAADPAVADRPDRAARADRRRDLLPLAARGPRPAAARREGHVRRREDAAREGPRAQPAGAEEARPAPGRHASSSRHRRPARRSTRARR